MRRIKRANISFISLVPRGANQLPVLFKSEGETAQFNTIVKSERFEEEGLLTAVVYVPDQLDSDGDFASAEVIKQMAHDYVMNVGAVDVKHNTQALKREQVSVVESFIIQKGDARFTDLKNYNGRPVDATGGWGVVIKVDDAELRRLYREGHWNGVSMFGPAVVEPLSKSIPDALASRLSKTNNQSGNDMDIKELTAALEANSTALAKTIVDGLVKALKPEPIVTPKDEAVLIKFEGDPTNPADVTAHQRKLRVALVKWDDAKSVGAYQAELAKEAADAATAAAAAAGKNADGSAKSVELVKAEAELAKAQAELTRVSKSSNQSTGDNKGGDSKGLEEATGLAKTDTDRFAIGSRMAKFANGGK